MKFISIITPRKLLKVISYWPPYLFSGIAVISSNEDMSEIVVRKKTNFYNQNYFGTHFGGSLFAMCDPFYVFILLNSLREEHIVWDRSGEIEFIKATRKPVTATFRIEPEVIETIKKQCETTFSIEPTFETDIVDPDGVIVAKIKKRLYVRRKDAKERFKRQPELKISEQVEKRTG